MKKRLLCIVIAMLLVLPLVLASCGGDSEKDKMKEIILGTNSTTPIDKALTLSIWVPTDAITIKGQTADLSELTQQQKDTLISNSPDVYEFLKRVDAVEDAINEILISRSYYTKIDIVPINNEYYEEALANRFSSMTVSMNAYISANTKVDGTKPELGYLSEGTSDLSSNFYSNEVVEEVVGNKVLYDLLYRPVRDDQLDIFLIRDYGEHSGYAQYLSYINSNYIIPLNDPQSTNYIGGNGKYASINKLIREPFLNELKVNDRIYALPNNHLYADQYQYILLNKKILGSYAQFDINDMTDFDSCIDFINAVGDKGEKGIVPLIANFDDVAGYDFVDKSLGLGGTITDEGKNIESIFSSEKFNSFVQAYKALQDKSYVKNELADDEKAAVRIFNGTSKEATEFSNDYYLVKTANPVAKTSDVYSSLFAISTFSLNYDRSMKILNLLQSDTQIRTLLQYGIENEDYSIVVSEDSNGNEIEKINIKDTAYKMNLLYTGNEYYTYPGDDTVIDDWQYEKDTNLDVTIDPFIGFEYYLLNNNLSQSEKDFLANNNEKYVSIMSEVYNAVSKMSSSEYEQFIKLHNDILDEYATIVENDKKIANNIVEINNKTEEKNKVINKLSADKMDQYFETEERYDFISERIDEIQNELDNGNYSNLFEQIELSDEKIALEFVLSGISKEATDFKLEISILKSDNIAFQKQNEECINNCANLISDNGDLITKYPSVDSLLGNSDFSEIILIYNKILKLM